MLCLIAARHFVVSLWHTVSGTSCRFSIYATICVATNFVVLTTFFLAAFVLNERRMAAHRLDCCCCIVAAAAKAQPSDGASTDGSSESAGAHPHAGESSQGPTVWSVAVEICTAPMEAVTGCCDPANWTSSFPVLWLHVVPAAALRLLTPQSVLTVIPDSNGCQVCCHLQARPA